MDTQNALLDLERRFWMADAPFFQEHVHERCLLAFRQMAGVMTAGEVANTVKGTPRWEEVKIAEPHSLALADDVFAVSYLAHARRAGERYDARVSSVYVKRDGRWKLAFHQHTAVGGEGALAG